MVRSSTYYADKWIKRIRIFSRLFLFKIGLDRRPVFGVLTVNSQCNFRCKYCFSDYYLKKEESLPTERMLKTIDELADYGVIYLNVHGGEALLRNDMGQIMDHALSKKMLVNFITNGKLLRRKWDEVKNVDSFCISLDGKEENNDKNRGKGTFRIAADAIEFALSKGAVVRIGMTITQHTKDDIRWMAEWAKKRNIYIQPYLLFDQENLPKELWMTPEENKKALKELIELKKQGYPIFYSLKTLEYSLIWPFNKAVLRERDLKDTIIPKDFKFIPCYYKRLNVLIENNGTVRTCNIMARSGTHISIIDNGVREAKEELLSIDDCLYCYHLSQMEFSNLMALSPGPVLGQLLSQFKEDIKTLRRNNMDVQENIDKQ